MALFRIILIRIVCSLVRDKDDALARAHSNLAEVETLQDKIGNYRENIQVYCNVVYCSMATLVTKYCC